MFPDEKAKQTLLKLGLSVLEAKTYIALIKYGVLTSKKLSELTKMSQPDTYRVLSKLQKKGLTEKIIKKPMQFKAVPLHLGTAFLLERKKMEHEDLKAKTNQLLQEIRKSPLPQPLETETSNFVMIPKRQIVVKRINEAIDNSKKSVDIFLSWKRFSVGVTSTFAESSRKAWDRGVKFRIIVEKPEKAVNVKPLLKFCVHPFCSVRFVTESPRTVLGIYDKKEVFIIVNPRKGLYDSPALWSNNQSLISVAQDYFEILWLTAMESNLHDPQ
jgi:sugar-specific transcriptional regulator TrmB